MVRRRRACEPVGLRWTSAWGAVLWGKAVSMVRITVLLTLLPLNASCGLSSFFPEDPPPSVGKLEVTEISLGRVPPSQDDLHLSRDQKRVAFKISENGKEWAVIDGKPQAVYDKVKLGRVFSPDSSRTGYTAVRDGKESPVIDGIEGRGYEPWDAMYVRFSPDSKRVAIRVRIGNNAVMIIDGVEGNLYKSIQTYEWPDVFSPDSKRTAYVGEKSEKQNVAVLDGVEGKAYEYIDDLQFSPDSNRILYRASRDGSSFVVVDGVEGPKFDYFSLFPSGHFSPDSQRVTYRACRKSGYHTMVVDSIAGTEYEEIEFHPMCFSPDSTHLAYVAKIGEKQCVVEDGKEGALYNAIEQPRYSPDGKLAYVAWKDDGDVTVCGGKEIAQGRAVFSPNWQHSAYAVRRGLKWTVVHDGKNGLQHGLGETWRTKIFFSPDSRRMGYYASQGRQIEFVVVDGVQSIRHQIVEVGDTIFSPDSKHVAYWGCPASGGWRIFVNGSYTEPYDQVILNSHIVFDGPDTLHGLAVRNGEILRVEIKIPPKKANNGQPQSPPADQPGG